MAVIVLDARLGCLAENLDPSSQTQKMIYAVHKLLEVLNNLEVGDDVFLWHVYPTKSWRKFVELLDFLLE